MRIRDEDVFDEEVVFADGFDDCVIGYFESAFDRSSGLVYDTEKIIDSLMIDGMTESDAREHFEFNIRGAYVGKGTPLFITPIDRLCPSDP
jgi:hypothetical protein